MRLWCSKVRIQYGSDFYRDLPLQRLQKVLRWRDGDFVGVPEDDFTLLSGKPKPFHYIAESGKGLDGNFCPDCGARIFSTNLESFPGTVFVTLGSLDRPELVERMLEMFTKRLKWEKPLDVPQICQHARLTHLLQITPGDKRTAVAYEPSERIRNGQEHDLLMVR